MDLTITSTAVDSTATVEVSGPIDLSNVARLRAALLHAVQSGCPAVRVDLSEVCYLAAIGIAALEEGRTHAIDVGLDFQIIAASTAADLVLTTGRAATLPPPPTRRGVGGRRAPSSRTPSD
jgi:anti-anti-sigma factor